MSNIYTVKEAYKVLMFEIASLSNPICLRAHHKSILSKFFLFVRSLIDNRNTIKDDLFRRGVIGKVGCSVVVKNRRYIFFESSVFADIRCAICNWIGISTDLHKECLSQLDQFTRLLDSGRSFPMQVLAIWFTCVCSI